MQSCDIKYQEPAAQTNRTSRQHMAETKFLRPAPRPAPRPAQAPCISALPCTACTKDMRGPEADSQRERRANPDDRACGEATRPASAVR